MRPVAGDESVPRERLLGGARVTGALRRMNVRCLRVLHLGAAFEGAAESDLVGEFEIATDWQA